MRDHALRSRHGPYRQALTGQKIKSANLGVDLLKIPTSNCCSQTTITRRRFGKLGFF
ncbi:hypothetical protein PATSB16_27850 [Pandoraea thiooxydans]|nr:hypothetical protein PATSB16_27850 [Pandoraea thiooxydans]